MQLKKVHELILKSYLGPMFLTFFIVMFVLLMNFMWRYIDELVGKGLDVSVILELMMYALVTMVPMGIPLATLLAAIMTMGNMGENNELLAMKSAGMSLPRIMTPLIIVVGLIAIASFFVSNNAVPWATRQQSALLYDIRKQKQTLEFKDGLFFTGMDNITIRVGRQVPETKLLKNVLIYDNRDVRGDMSTSLADSGYIRLSDDGHFLLMTLYNGSSFEQTRNNRQWANENKLRRNYFEVQDIASSLAGYAFERTDANSFGNSMTKNITELEQGIDSLKQITEESNLHSFKPFFRDYIFPNDETVYVDSLAGTKQNRRPVLLTDSLKKLDVRARERIWGAAVGTSKGSVHSFTYDEDRSKESLSQLYRYEIEWHRKWALPVSIMIFFLIGAPLGAIIRKGGLGMPIVVSVLFFVIYYIISMTGEKMAREGTWQSGPGAWISSFVLLPIAVFLVYKATNDSNLFNAERWIQIYHRVRDFVKKMFNIIKNKRNGSVRQSA